jgi:hypothetical protein
MVFKCRTFKIVATFVDREGKEDYLTSFPSSEETGRTRAVTSQEIREHRTDCLTTGRSPWLDRTE